VDLNPFLDNTDDQQITAFSLDNATDVLTLTLEDGGTQTVDFTAVLAAAGTDDQALSLAAGNILTLEDGGTVDLTPFLDNTDNQNLSIGTGGVANQSVEVAISGGTNAVVDIRDGDADPSNELITSFGVNGTDLRITEAGVNFDVPLSALGSDDQNAGEVAVTDTAGNFTATDVEGALAELAGASTDDQTLSWLNTDLTISEGNTVDLRSFTNTANVDAFSFTSSDGTTGEKDVFTITDLDNGGGSQDHSSVFKVVKSGTISNVDNGFSLIELANTGTDPGANKYWISGRKTDEGAPLWGVDITDNDFWSEGGITLGVTGNAAGTYSGGNFTVTNSGQITSSDLSGVGTRMVVADASGVLSTQSVVVNSDNQNLSIGTGGVANQSVEVAISGGTNAIVDIRDADADATNEIQTASEVNSDTPVDVDGDGNTEATVEDVIQDIAPIVSKSARIFYPPSIAVDASTTGTGRTLNLYTEYTNQYATPAVASAGAPAAIPTYGATELYYYVTFFDTNVFANVSVDANGLMTYDVIAPPADYNSLINVVFVVK
ncbi:hypothetical protein ACKWCC_13320, partial [Maribacter sp. 2307ULW6-5]